MKKYLGDEVWMEYDGHQFKLTTNTNEVIWLQHDVINELLEFVEQIRINHM